MEIRQKVITGRWKYVITEWSPGDKGGAGTNKYQHKIYHENVFN